MSHICLARDSMRGVGVPFKSEKGKEMCVLYGKHKDKNDNWGRS